MKQLKNIGIPRLTEETSIEQFAAFNKQMAMLQKNLSQLEIINPTINYHDLGNSYCLTQLLIARKSLMIKLIIAIQTEAYILIGGKGNIALINSMLDELEEHANKFDNPYGST